ncbi:MULTISPECIES: hypothetical protein [unclassified Bacillus (in: firmicutes)]|uniref:hypothetical protein n=1 Tax=unclassified Bacillus (in: firmicutes) TaxID=185979 RepID=UPI0008F3BC8A|nr:MULTISPECIES: hypothetical protein [unclassified Bacillus (in: firmicutes)]SFB17493.1 hypothetical protein SAMN02799634_107157 [Bacillus sp. UNCCL13]SFQ76981.1 hypothetical protein SAMN04488577_1485 [Bacillus sp. cl95]
MDEYFIYDSRLGIPLPDLNIEFSELAIDVQQEILFKWEKIRGTIPDRIHDIEQIINHKQAKLSVESDFPRSCQLNTEIADHASVINELWLWYRANQGVTEKMHQ